MAGKRKRPIVVCPASELPPGGRRIIGTADGRTIGVFNVGGIYHALRNRCPHAGAELCKGAITGMNEASAVGTYHWVREGEILRCPWHGWEFDILTGRSVVDPGGVRVATYETGVTEDGTVMVWA